MIAQLGKQKRLDRILSHNGKTFIVPVDDLLINGTNQQLVDYMDKVPLLGKANISAVLGFPGVFNQFYAELKDKPWIINLTTSTTLSEHLHKRLSLSLKHAISMGCDAVAVHVNITSSCEGSMIQNLAAISCECQDYGIPLLAIVYARKEGSDGMDDNYLQMKNRDRERYTAIVSHACRVAVELGADIIKTNYTGDADSFQKVIYAAGSVPVVIAGGQQISEQESLDNVRGALQAGAAGICFGRNFFYRDNVLSFAEKVGEIINELEGL
jgi:DhnA family fructose-bisphosphate aldolase class Ia